MEECELKLTKEEKEGLSGFLKYMPSELFYRSSTSYRLRKSEKSPWVFWSHPALSSADSVRSSTPVADLVIKEKVKSALQKLKYYCDDDDEILYQFWAPETIEGRCFLTTSDQPFALNKIDRPSSLQSYRRHSLGYKFRVDEGASEENLGLPGRVFRTRVPEFTPYIRYYSNKEYPQRCHAVNCKLKESFALPVFKSNGQVAGVLECIFTRFNGCLFEFIVLLWLFLESVGLQYLFQCVHLDDFHHLSDTLKEIKEVFKVVCKTHTIPFAQTWVPCKHCSVIAYGDGYVCPNEEVLVTPRDGLYLHDTNMVDFLYNGFYLNKGQGVAGKAYLSSNSCFCRDVTQLTMFQYPQAHHARHLGLAGSFAICLRSSKTGDLDYILEFFMPPSESNCEDPIRTLLDPLMVTMKQHFRTFKHSSGKELGDELPVEVLEPNINMCEKLSLLTLCQSTRSPPPRSEPLQSGRETMKVDLPYQQPMVKIEAVNERRNDSVRAERIDEAIPCSEIEVTTVNTTVEKDRMRINNEISISREVIHQHLEKSSLEDAAKSLNVSRSTLKRRCRGHGIKRWKPPKGKSKNRSLQQTTRRINKRVKDSSQTMVQASLATSSLHAAGGSASWDQTNSFLAFQQREEIRLPKDLHPLAAEASLEEQDHMVEKFLKPQQWPTHEIKIPQLTPQEMDIVDYIFHSRESSGETLVNYQLEHATHNEIYTLRAGIWLSDVIINLMVCKLTFEEIRRHPDFNCRAWYLRTYIAQQILGEGAQVSTMAKQYFGPERYWGSLSACEKVFIPVNVRSEHWFLCVIDMRQRAVYILDPLLSPSSDKEREEMVGKIVYFMDKLLAHLHGDEYKIRIVDFPIQRLDWVPQQKNSYDCGVFIIKFMECQNLQPGVQFNFDSKSAREKIAVDLVLEEHNNVRGAVLENVQRHKSRKERR